jgi:hypothetical protein
MFTDEQWEDIRQAEQASRYKQRRERIATSLMAGLIDGDVTMQGLKCAAQTALIGADILIEEIDGPGIVADGGKP